MQKRIESRSRSQRVGKRGTNLGAKEKRRLIQLLLCIGLFAVVLVGKGIAPERLMESGESLLQMIQTDTDFQGAFAALGQSISQGEPILESLEALAVQVFGAGETEKEVITSGKGLAVEAAMSYMQADADPQIVLLRLEQTVRQSETAEEQLDDGTAADTEPDGSTAAAASPDLPEGTTMDYVELGLEETATPVLGVVSSSFGYREDPNTGEYLFHNGVDIAAEEGTPILAFADGTVEFTGEDDTSGLYLQIDHGNETKTFYCHCSVLYVQEGDAVVKGQAIAAVGETGNATGPHLHFAIKYEGVRLNPVYYIETVG